LRGSGAQFAGHGMDQGCAWRSFSNDVGARRVNSNGPAASVVQVLLWVRCLLTGAVDVGLIELAANLWFRPNLATETIAVSIKVIGILFINNTLLMPDLSAVHISPKWNAWNVMWTAADPDSGAA